MVKPVDPTSPQYQTFKTQLAELHKLMLIARETTAVSALRPYFSENTLQNDYDVQLDNKLAVNDPRLFLMGVTRGFDIAPANYLNEPKNCDAKIKFQSLPFAELSPLQIALATLSIPNFLNTFNSVRDVIKVIQQMYFRASKEQNLLVDENDLFQIDFLLYAAEEALNTELQKRDPKSGRAFRIKDMLTDLNRTLEPMIQTPKKEEMNLKSLLRFQENQYSTDKYLKAIVQPIETWRFYTPVDDRPAVVEPSPETKTLNNSETDQNQVDNQQSGIASEQKPATPQKPENFYHNPSKRTKVLQKIAAALVAVFSAALYPLYVWWKTRNKMTAFEDTKGAKVMCDRNLEIVATPEKDQEVFELTSQSQKAVNFCLAYSFEYERRLFGNDTDKALFDNARKEYASRMTMKMK